MPETAASWALFGNEMHGWNTCNIVYGLHEADITAMTNSEGTTIMLNEVLAVNRQRRIAAIRKSEGITVFSWDGSVEVSEGDLIQGDLDELDNQSWCFNASVGLGMGVKVVATHCSDDGAVQLLFV